MDVRLLRGLFSRPSTLASILRSPLEYLPTYATLFGDDNRPATFIVLVVWLLFWAGFFAWTGPLSFAKAKTTHMVRCHIAMAVLSLSVSLPMPHASASTFRCYGIILVLVLQVHYFARTRGILSHHICLFHPLATSQLLLLPGIWARIEIRAEDDNGFGSICFFWLLSHTLAVMISWEPWREMSIRRKLATAKQAAVTRQEKEEVNVANAFEATRQSEGKFDGDAEADERWSHLSVDLSYAEENLSSSVGIGQEEDEKIPYAQDKRKQSSEDSRVDGTRKKSIGEDATAITIDGEQNSHCQVEALNFTQNHSEIKTDEATEDIEMQQRQTNDEAVVNDDRSIEEREARFDPANKIEDFRDIYKEDISVFFFVMCLIDFTLLTIFQFY